MKELKFKTSKGEFLVVDKNNNWHFGQKFNYYGENKFDAFNVVDVNKCFSYSKSLKLSEITEGQASEIIEEFKYHPTLIKKVFIDYFNEDFYLESTIESLHSLLKSKGIHLFENPYPEAGLIPSAEQQLYREAEAKTFYNPYIFRKD